MQGCRNCLKTRLQSEERVPLSWSLRQGRVLDGSRETAKRFVVIGAEDQIEQALVEDSVADSRIVEPTPVLYPIEKHGMHNTNGAISQPAINFRRFVLVGLRSKRAGPTLL